MTSRLGGVLRGLKLLAVGATVASVLAENGLGVVAQDSGTTDGDSGFGVVASLNDNSSNYDEAAAYIARGYASTMQNNERRLTTMSDSLLTESVCGGEPMVILKSTTVPANGACLPEQSSYNLSCACISGLANTTAWNFRVQAPKTEPMAPFSTTLNESDAIEIDSLMLLDIPADLLTFRIQGVKGDQVPVSIGAPLAGDDTPTLVRSKGISSLMKADVSNLDLFGIPMGPGFLPTTLTNLTMRHCNISSLDESFLGSFTRLQALNLEANRISSIYTTLPGSGDALNAMTEIILANNSFTEFPVQLLRFPNLQSLDLSGNNIANLTLTSDEFAVISSLSFFRIDGPGNVESNCAYGEWHETHATRFCVVNAIISTPVPDSSDESTTNWVVFVVIAALGGCLVGFFLFFLATKLLQHQRERRASKPGSQSPAVREIQTSHAADDTLTQAFYDSLHPTINADLLNDPLIMSYRLKFKDLHVGRCISKGGFGLVYSGVYRHRRVAVKKIMREKCEKESQIRMFVREITLMGSLKHERIVEFIGVAWDSLRNLSAVTEYMERGDLRDVLHALKHQGNNVDHSFTWQGRKLTIALHIAEGLAYMHSLSPKVIHRDLKSKNVLLNSEYAAKLSDFGVSRERLAAEDGVRPGRFMTPGVGTSFWIAPEVLLGRDYDERADIFSFGVVLSEIDTDDYPYWNSGSAQAQDNADERRSQEQKILEKVALGSLRPTFYNDCPPGVLALAANCLEGRPENRPSASEVVLTISELICEIQLNSRAYPEPEPDQIATDGFLSSASSR